MNIFFKGFNYSQDGPGNRLVYHLQGCNMRCPWCSNPEGMSFDGGEKHSVRQILEECKRCRPMFFAGGGVTFTGGEATLQHGELTELLRELRCAGIHTALETNGTSPYLPEIQRYVDYLMMDFKHYDPALFLSFTGVNINQLIRNYEYLCGIRRQLHVRIPLINRVNADNAESFALCFSRFDNSNTVFEFLPYHEYGKEKWKTEYTITDGFVSSKQIDIFKEVFRKYKLKVINT
jgi:pyruvate formate lyase activating enzyme